MNQCDKNYFGCYFIESLFSSIDVYSVLVDISGKIVYSSKKFRSFFNIENIADKKLSDFINHTSYEELRKLMLEVIFTNNQVSKDISFNDKDIYKVVIFPIINQENKVTHLVLGAVNVTSNRKLELENQELKRKLEESNSIKSIFLSNISHELRTPMNAIIGFSNLLLQNSANQNDKFLKSINSNAKYLNELLDNILDYSKLESNEFDLLYENFCINDLFDELKDIFDDFNYKKNLDFVKLEFIKNEDKKIICDYLRLKQVLFNIISNSIKFTERGFIKVSYSESDDCIIFKIQDTGIGIHEEKIQFIFDRFWQCDSTSRKKYKGAGLGLSISKSIVEMFNGKIWAESELGKGTTIFIKIPLEEVKQEILVIKSKDKTNFSGKTVLIVDELPMNYSILSIYLNSLHINMIFTYSGKDAIKTFKKQKDKIDLIILDMNLPDMDINHLSTNLKSIGDCKIISKSGIDLEKNENIDYNLIKPFSKNKLIFVLNEIWQK